MKEITGKYNTCKVFTENIDKNCINQLSELMNLECIKDSKIRIMPDCLTEDTEILTTNGFKLIKGLTLKDEIANYNPLNKKIFFSNPKNIVNRPLKKGETIFEYFNEQQNFAFKVSENHRMAIKNNMGKEAKFIEQPKMSDMIFNGEGLEEDFCLTKFSDNEIRLICWIVGDGNIKITHNAHSDNYRIRFGLKKQRKIDRLTQLLNEEKIEYKVFSTEKQSEICINTKCSKKYLEMVSLDKVYPKDFIFLNKDQSKVFIDEIIMIDGDYEAYKNNKGYRVYSTNKYNIDIISAIISLNYGYNKINYKDHYLYYINVIKQDSLNYSRSGLHNRKVNRREIEYDGNLVCVECDTSYFIARQNGLVFVTGNCHAGSGCVIGTTMTLTDKVIPNLVGVDIGCGMLVIKLVEKSIDFAKLDNVIHTDIPSGRNIHNETDSQWTEKCERLIQLDSLIAPTNKTVDKLSIGTLGSGNHFLEVDKDEDGSYYLVIHTGSRHLGVAICKYYQRLSYKRLTSNEVLFGAKIAEMRMNGRQSEIAAMIDDGRKNFVAPDKDLTYVTGDDFKNYLHDMDIAKAFAIMNRNTIASNIIEAMGWHMENSFETLHNYIDTEHMILRKGSVSAMKGEKLIIPLNMRDGSLICVGKGNEDWNYSAPHGAGRVLSRYDAKREIKLSDFKETMKDIYSTSICEETLDESPFAYKSAKEIIECIRDTVDIINMIKPVYNFKATK